MALALYDRVQQTGTANTTVSFTLSATPAGYQSFSVVGNGNTTYYSAFDSSGNWEVGIGTYATGGTLTRTTILSSSNSGSAVTFSGSVTVFVTQPAEQTVVSSNNPGTSSYVLTSNGSGIAPTWQASGGGGGTPGGSTTQAQYNNSGSFGGITNITVKSGQTTARIDPRVSVESNSATSVTPDISLYDMYVWTGLSTAGTLTINAPIGTPVIGDKLMFRIQDDGTGNAVTLSWASSGSGYYRPIGVPLPTNTGGFGKVVYVGCVYNPTGNGTVPTWDVVASGTQL
jgi:hypothetical protein